MIEKIQTLRGVRSLPLLALLAVATIVGGLAGCKSEETDQAEIEQNLEETPAADVVADAALNARFEPPTDGKLSEDQVEMYVDVREREKQILGTVAQDLQATPLPPAGAGAPPSPGPSPAPGAGAAPQGEVTVSEVPAAEDRDELRDMATADARAAQELGHDPLEYQWVRGQVLQAQLALYGGGAAGASGRDELITSLREMREATADTTAQGMIDRKIEELSTEAPPTEPNEALRHNMDLVREHQQEIRTVESWPDFPAGASPARSGV